MTKLQVSIKKETKEEVPAVMKLYLEQLGDVVVLCGVDRAGKDWTIAWIDGDGIRLSNGITGSTGWPLDNDGRLKLVE